MSTTQSTTRVITVGGVSKPQLLANLHEAGVQLNELGRALFSDDRFTTSSASTIVESVEVSVAALGFEDGAIFDRIAARAEERGLTLCPLELGPHLRLQFLDQPEGYIGPEERHRAPRGSLTIASLPLSDDEDQPRGFYLRRIQGVLWLRGFQAADEHIYQPEDRFIFLRQAQQSQ